MILSIRLLHHHHHIGVNSRVSDAADWIDEMVCKLSVSPPRDFVCSNRENQTTLFSGVGVRSFALGFVTALLLLVVMYCLHRVAWAYRRRLHRGDPCLGRCWWLNFRSGNTTFSTSTIENVKLMPLKTDSSLSSSSDAASDTSSYGSVGNVQVM